MFSSRSGINLNVLLVSLFNFIFANPKQQKNQTYDYTQFMWGRDYMFEPVDNLTKGYMTGQGKGIKRGDNIILRNQADADLLYEVEEIDYYSEPPEMWIALLQRKGV